jgi:hypothetical protein
MEQKRQDLGAGDETVSMQKKCQPGAAGGEGCYDRHRPGLLAGRTAERCFRGYVIVG